MNPILPPKHYTALTIVSAAMHGGETKDQDRAAWCESLQSGTLADGVSSSVNAARAAELVTGLGPAVLQGDVPGKMELVSHLLVGLRLRALESSAPQLPDHAALWPMLAEVYREKMESSFQTTMVGIGLVHVDSAVLATIVRCGDSGLFAFSGQGEPLATCLPQPRPADPEEESSSPDTFSFGPGDELLARIVGPAYERPDLVREHGLRPAAASNWVVCSVVERSRRSGSYLDRTIDSRPVLRLRPRDLLLVPPHLIQRPRDPQYGEYCMLRYSSLLRCHGIRPTPDRDLGSKGVATAVLPDSVFKKEWVCFEDRFELDTHFVLASDGFYSAFSKPAEIWEWLCQHQSSLACEPERLAVMTDLHTRLNDRGGDDDMSFIWIMPRDWQARMRVAIEQQKA